MTALEHGFTVAEQTLVDRVREYVRDGSGTGILLVEDMTAADFDDAPGQLGPSWQKTERLDERLTIEYRRAT